MTSGSLISGWPPFKQGAILDSLRQEIVSGELAPGSRMPTRDELGVRFGVTRMTMQKAMDQLGRDGFIVSRGKRGTFIADNPPHLSSYSLVFCAMPTEAGFPRFWTALANEAVTLERTQNINIKVYYGVKGSTDNEGYQSLLRDIRARRLAGLIFTAIPEDLQNTPISENDMPKVGIISPVYNPQVPAVYPDMTSFVDRALDALVAKGRKRVGVLGTIFWWEQLQHHFVQGARDRGLEFQPFWAQMVDPLNAHRAVHLLMHQQQQSRPDGLIIADDNLVEHSTAGLLAAGVRVPADIDVVAHCNFPWPVASVVPVLRLGFDACQVMATCLKTLEMQRGGETPPSYSPVSAMFENEINAPSRPGSLVAQSTS